MDGLILDVNLVVIKKKTLLTCNLFVMSSTITCSRNSGGKTSNIRRQVPRNGGSAGSILSTGTALSFDL